MTTTHPYRNPGPTQTAPPPPARRAHRDGRDDRDDRDPGSHPAPHPTWQGQPTPAVIRPLPWAAWRVLLLVSAMVLTVAVVTLLLLWLTGAAALPPAPARIPTPRPAGY